PKFRSYPTTPKYKQPSLSKPFKPSKKPLLASTNKMPKTAETVEKVRKKLAKNLIRRDLLKDVDHQTRPSHAHKSCGPYKSREKSHKSKQWLDLTALRERLDERRIEIAKLRKKFSKKFGAAPSTNNTLKMPETIEKIRDKIAEKSLIRWDLLEDVNDQTRLFQDYKSSGEYKNREESHKSPEWLDLLAARKRLDENTIEIAKLRKKLNKKLEAAGRA
ncbi:hypothetical protein HOY82DRAFT_629512, partial [Tuber indicum]